MSIATLYRKSNGPIFVGLALHPVERLFNIQPFSGVGRWPCRAVSNVYKKNIRNHVKRFENVTKYELKIKSMTCRQEENESIVSRIIFNSFLKAESRLSMDFQRLSIFCADSDEQSKIALQGPSDLLVWCSAFLCIQIRKTCTIAQSSFTYIHLYRFRIFRRKHLHTNGIWESTTPTSE